MGNATRADIHTLTAAGKHPISHSDRAAHEIQSMFPSLSREEMEKLLENYSPYGLTPKQRDRLDELEEEYGKNIRSAKIEKFKSLPRETRESIVREIEKRRGIAEIITTMPDVPDELKELRGKDQELRKAENNYHRPYNSSSVIPGINDDDILEAYSEMELLDTESNS